MNTSIKWAGQLAHVREVSLLGTADMAFWKDRLLNENLLPAASEDGSAQILIVAADLTFMGVRFRELSFSVLVCRQEQGRQQDAAYLVGAFNSNRAFAWCERVFFAAPYDHADVRVSASFPASMHLVKQAEVLFQAEMRANSSGPSRVPSRREEHSWEGPIFLPKGRRGRGRQGDLFFARIRGYIETYPFIPAQDSLALRPARGSEALQALLDSHFVAKEWAIREDATHAKSKTYTRAKVLPAVTDVNTRFG
jgi:hypothetical protein